MVFSVPTKTHGYIVPLTITGVVFTGTGRGMRKYTRGLPVSCLSEQPILKKGAGRGSNRNDVICSTYGWLANAGVQLEYGKNYEGYWTG
jgi:hypothetical protein